MHSVELFSVNRCRPDEQLVGPPDAVTPRKLCVTYFTRSMFSWTQILSLVSFVKNLFGNGDSQATFGMTKPAEVCEIKSDHMKRYGR